MCEIPLFPVTPTGGEDTLEAQAAACAGAIFGPQDAAGGAAADWSWRFEPAWPIDDGVPIAGMNRAAWCAWMRDELADDAADGGRREWHRLLHEPIAEPIVAVEVGPERARFLWDGHHRVGATLLTGRATLAAIVGRRPASTMPGPGELRLAGAAPEKKSA